MGTEKIKDGVVMQSEDPPEEPRGAFCADHKACEHAPDSHYIWSYRCDNCQRLFHVYIPKGTRKEDVSWSHVCANCGVRQVNR